MSLHSIIAPSSAGIWGKPDGCTGYVLMAQLYPETEETPEAAEGSASHWVGADTLLSYGPDEDFKLCADYVGKVCPENGVVITEEMTDGASLYVGNVLKLCQERGLLGALQIEQRLEMPAIHELAFGTSDCWIYDSKAHELFAWDYKFGFEAVEAFENWQTLMYLDGIVDKLGFKGTHDQDLKITLRIVQPRAFHRDGPIREWKTTGGALRGYTNILHANAHTALGPDAVCNTGSHCKNCSARTNCEAAITAGARLFEAASAPAPVDISTAALATQATLVTRAYKHLKALKIGYDSQIEGKVRAGEIVPGWTTEATFGREKWDKPIAEVIAMGDMMGKDLRKLEAITPKAAVKSGIDEAVIKAYSTQPRTGVKVTQDNGTKAKQVFTI
jgi:hypothetical protein